MVQVRVDSVRLFGQSGVCLGQISVARVLRDEQVGLVPIVVTCFHNQRSFEFLLVYLSRLDADFDQHFDALLKVNSLDELAVPLLFNFGQLEFD